MRDFEYDSLAFAGSTEARENALAAAATPPPLLCGAAVSCVRLACVPLLLTKASREEVLHALVAVVANVSRLRLSCVYTGAPIAAGDERDPIACKTLAKKSRRR